MEIQWRYSQLLTQLTISDFLFILVYSLYSVKLESELLPAVLLLFEKNLKPDFKIWKLILKSVTCL